MTLTIEQRIEEAAEHVARGEIIQGEWREVGEDGRELVCALAAFGSDINAPEDCPANLMPQWMAGLVPELDDGIAAADVLWFAGELVQRARRWVTFTATQWNRARVSFLEAIIRNALASAERAQPTPRPDYWPKIVDACEAVIRALRDGGDLTKAKEAAEDAADATWVEEGQAGTPDVAAAINVVEAAAAAAWSDEKVATMNAAWSASLVPVTAAEAEGGAVRWSADLERDAAESAAWKGLAEMLFAAIDAEIGS